MSKLNLKTSIGISTIISLSIMLSSCGGGSAVSFSTGSSPVSTKGPVSTIVAAATACANEPIRGDSSNKVYYYCDCGTGAQNGCVAGNDANLGTDPSAPRQTIGNAIARFSALEDNDTVALCKGGVFNSAGGHNIGTAANARCPVGRTCNDLREYTQPSIPVGAAKPIINLLPGGETLFRFYGRGGTRLLNLKLKGDVDGSTTSGTGVLAISGAQDVTMCNLDIDGFAIAVYSESGFNGNNKNIELTGSYISNSRSQGFLGAADNLKLNYNHWEGNASHHVSTHAIYFSSNKTSVSNMEVIGNYVHGQRGNTCRGTVIVGHVSVVGFRFENNTVDIEPLEASPTCFGIGFSLDNGTTPLYIRNARFSNNTVKNGGSLAFSVGECPGCLIENNLIIQNWPALYLVYGMSLAADGTRGAGGPVDDVSNNVTIKNNTVWFGPELKQGGYGIVIGSKGTGHIISNNTVTYTTKDARDGGFSCYAYPLAPGSYAFINNNHCHTALATGLTTGFEWVKGSGDLAKWQGSGFDADSITGEPSFTAAGTNFKPTSLSPLIGKGNKANASLKDFTGVDRPASPAIGAYE